MPDLLDYSVYLVYFVYSVCLAPFIRESHGLKANMGEFFTVGQSNI